MIGSIGVAGMGVDGAIELRRPNNESERTAARVTMSRRG
jgi:hypothetical protein